MENAKNGMSIVASQIKQQFEKENEKNDNSLI